MSIKRFVLIGLCLALALPFACFAEVDPDAYWYPINDTEYGYDHDAYNHDVAAEMIVQAGINLNADDYFVYDGESYRFDNDAFMRDYNALVSVEPTPVDPDPVEEENVPEPTPVPWLEDIDDEVETIPTENDSTFLENTNDLLNVGLENNLSELPQMDILTSGSETETAIEHTVVDLRSNSSYFGDVAELGLKSVIRSIFGEYTPNMTTTTVTETVDGEVVTTLIDVIASGSAGVDWEYISGVFLFGLMLFCLFKLLGGILS